MAQTPLGHQTLKAMEDGMKAFNKVTEISLKYRHKKDPKDYPKVACSRQAYDLFMQSWDKDKIELSEQFRVMLLDSNNKCLGVSTIASGGIGSVDSDLRLTFAAAIKSRATKIILAHNHPSGNLNQSPADQAVTDKFIAAGKILEVPVIDHLIVTRRGYTSFADLGFI